MPSHKEVVWALAVRTMLRTTDDVFLITSELNMLKQLFNALKLAPRKILFALMQSIEHDVLEAVSGFIKVFNSSVEDTEQYHLS